MFDRELVREILTQVAAALDKIAGRIEPIRSAEDFTASPAGLEKLDSICMHSHIFHRLKKSTFFSDAPPF